VGRLGPFALFISSLLLGPYAGVVADRFDRRGVVAITQIVAMIMSAALAVLFTAGRMDFVSVLGAGFLLGAANTIAVPAHVAVAGDLVRAQHIRVATGLLVLRVNCARAIGPLIGAAAIAWSGAAAACWFNSAGSA
jgi:MFS family permease